MKETSKMKKVIITGAGGFIGGSLCEHLLKQDISVIGIDIHEGALKRFDKYANFTPVVATFEDYSNLTNLITDREFDVFYHYAWNGVFGAPFKDHTLQLSNTKYTCDAIYIAKELGCKKFVLAGTMNQYEVLGYMNDSEIAPRYTCIYSSSKFAADMMCKTIAHNIGIEYNSGLIAMVYGEGNKSKMVPNVVMGQLLKGEEPQLIEGNNIYDLIYIGDVVGCFEAIGKDGKNLKSYYVGHRKEQLKTFKELFLNIGEILNPNVQLNFGAFPDASTVDYSFIDTDSLYEDTGYECKADFKESVLNTAKWLKEAGM